ncbi:hypothetical protein ACLOJK_018938 [Asimina triloba]
MACVVSVGNQDPTSAGSHVSLTLLDGYPRARRLDLHRSNVYTRPPLSRSVDACDGTGSRGDQEWRCETRRKIGREMRDQKGRYKIGKGEGEMNDIVGGGRGVGEEGEDEPENDDDAELLRMKTAEGEEGEDEAMTTLRRAIDSGERGRGGESLASAS